MIKINKYFTKKDSQSIYKGLSQKRQDGKPLLENLKEQKNKHSFRPDLYGSDKIKRKLRSFFHDKCAFCESYAKSAENEGQLQTIWQVEHYRPKAGVTEDKDHKGYYWLAYESTNLLTACYRCNALSKGNHFPIKGGTERAKADSFIENDEIDFNKCTIHNITEQAILLNPVIDNPDDFLLFCKDGSIKSKEENERGKQTIDILGLDKPDLVRERKTIIDAIRNGIQKEALKLHYETKKKKSAIISKSAFRVIIKHYYYKEILLKIRETTTPYIAFRVAILRNFEEFILKNEDKTTDKDFVLPYQSELLNAYREVIKKSSIQ